MLRYTLARLAAAIPVLVLVTAITFFGIHIIPGDLAAARLGDQANPSDVATLRHQMGLDEPMPLQYVHWLGGMVSGSAGRSLTSDLSVANQLEQRIPVTLELGLLSVLLSVLIGVPLGVLSAVHRGRASDYAVRVVAVLGQAVPNFWLGVVALTVSSIYFSWVPPVTYQPLASSPLANFQQFALPALITGYGLAAVVMRVTRSTMLEALSQDYIRTARAKGLSDRSVTYSHALRSALVPTVTVVSTQIGALAGGLVLMETVFSLPGIGQLTLAAITNKDYTQLQFNVLVIGAVVVLVNLLTDLSYPWLDPRTRHQ